MKRLAASVGWTLPAVAVIAVAISVRNDDWSHLKVTLPVGLLAALGLALVAHLAGKSTDGE